MNQKTIIIRRAVISISLLMFTFQLNAQTNADGWSAFVNNDPVKARNIFGSNISSPDSKTAGEAYRGLAFSCDFMGLEDSCMVYLLRAYMKDKDEISLTAASQSLIPFSRTHSGHFVSEGYKVYTELSKQKSMYNACHIEDLANRYVNDGKLSKATKLLKPLGTVHTFRMIGPFENISGSGYRKVFPPEQELDFSARYRGKDGSEASWFPYVNEAVTGWTFTENNYTSKNAVIYYYSNIRSETEQSVNIGFGASGAFKVFLNDDLVLADSVFRNTGIDMYMQKVSLHKGDNKLLIKLCHEKRNSNFLVRFFGDDGRGLPSISYNGEKADYTPGSTTFGNLTNSPFVSRIENYLTDRLNKNDNDLEAAFLLVRFYNIAEMTDKGQKLASRFIQKYPQSSVWQEMYSEALMRGRKITDAQTAIKSAYRNCNYNYKAWTNELEVIGNSAGLSDVKQFILKSPEQFRNTLQAQLYMFSYYAETENKSEAIKILDLFEREYLGNEVVVNILANLYASQGNTRRAEAILNRYIDYERTATGMFSTLSDVYLRMGQKSKAVSTLMQCLKYSPNEPGIYYYLAKLSLQNREFSAAQQYIDKGLKLMPSSPGMVALQGSIKSAQGKTEEAKEAFRKSIRFAYNSFDAWSQLLALEGKQEPQNMVEVPEPGELIKSTKEWKDLSGDNGAILSYTKDVFLYPSKCSRERYFLMVHLPTQSAIDNWKEYRISFNSYYQALSVAKAYSRSATGKETPADVSQNLVVFKTLLPGDNIVLEWTLDNYYQFDMARNLWGEHEFSLRYPVYETKLRLVTPGNDSIPYTVHGANITVSKDTVQDFLITSFSRGAYKNSPREPFSFVENANDDKVFYSSFPSWSSIVDWYLNLTENKVEQTYELKELVDSLTQGVTDDREKVRRVHNYITKTVRYSFIPFRQSGWIPQQANEVLASRIGDCKDMASLGKSMLDIAGIPSDLVLVSTRDQNSIYPSYVGPDFNHCILSYVLDGKREFTDLTDRFLSLGSLPRMDQGALALIVKRGTDSLIHLPVDSANGRFVKRVVQSVLDSSGTLIRKIESTRTGIHAESYRSSYISMPLDERKKDLQKVLASTYSQAVVDSFIIEGLDSLTDTVFSDYHFTAKNAAQVSGTTILFDLDINDRIKPDYFPSDQNRTQDIDMLQSWFGIGTFALEGELAIPQGWRLVNMPQNVQMSDTWGEYSLNFTLQDNKLIYVRKAVFDFRNPIKADQSADFRSLMSRLADADNVQLVFMKE